MKGLIVAIAVQCALAWLRKAEYTQSNSTYVLGDYALCNVAYDSNLGGKGPEWWLPKELRYYEVFKDVDLVLTTIGNYNPRNPRLNGLTGNGNSKSCFGVFNVRGGGWKSTKVQIKFNFYKTKTKVPVSIGPFYFSWFDIDESSTSTETVIFYGVDKMYVHPGTELDYTRGAGAGNANYSHTFRSTQFGNGADNPEDPLNLTDLQMKRSVTAMYHSVSEWRADVFVTGGFGGRNFVFAGRSALVSGKAKVNIIRGTPTPSPTPIPTEEVNGRRSLTLFPTPSGSPTPTPTITPSTVRGAASATGDPHMTNMRGDSFDLWQLGHVQFLRIPYSATRSDAEFVLDAIVENSTSDWRLQACLSPYVVKTVLSGRSIPDKVFVSVSAPGRVTVRINGSTAYFQSTNKQVGEIFGQPLYMRKTRLPIKHPRLSLKTGDVAEFLVGDAVIQLSAGKAHLNVLAHGLLTFKERIGGLLGEDEHTVAATPPKSCVAEGNTNHTLEKYKTRTKRSRKALTLFEHKDDFPSSLRNTAMYSP